MNCSKKRPRRKITFQFWVVFGWPGSSRGLKIEPLSIFSDKKAYTSPAYFKFAVSCGSFSVLAAKLRAYKEKEEGKQTLTLSFFNPDLSFNAALFLSYPVALWLNKVDGEKWSNRLKICFQWFVTIKIVLASLMPSTCNSILLLSPLLELQHRLEKVIVVVKITMTFILEYGGIIENVAPLSIVVTLR